MRVVRQTDGELRVSGLAPLHVDTLMQVPGWLRSDDPAVRGRLLPETYEDRDAEEQWRRYAAPELEHLFQSRAEILAKDLESLEQEGALAFSLSIPAAHGTAWLSALNAARLALFSMHSLSEVDMERDPAELDDFDAELALMRIHIMAYLQELLLDVGV